jgi:hypothetical protein
MSTSFSLMNPLFSRVNRSSVLTFDFFHSRLGSARGGDRGGATPVAAAAASARLLFFPPTLDVFDGDGFILQVQGVFTRIRSGATLEASGGDALRSTTAAAGCWEWIRFKIQMKMTAAHLSEKT